MQLGVITKGVLYVQHSHINKYNANNVRFSIDMVFKMCKTIQEREFGRSL